MDMTEMLLKVKVEVAKELGAAIEATIAEYIGRESTTVRKTTKRRGGKKPTTYWIADKNSKRAPNWVLEMTGLKTKKDIVEKFGVNSRFEKGKPLPKKQ